MAGIVYHANYLKFIERARSDWVRAQGIDQAGMRDAQGLVFAVRRLEAEFRAPARFDEVLEVHTRLQGGTGVRLVMDQDVRRGETVLFSARVTLVCLSLTGRAARLPANIRRILHEIAGRGASGGR